MHARLTIILVAVGAIGTLSFAWSLHRLSGAVLVDDPKWPRDFLYPDHWLWALNDWYDARHPASPNHLKIHGELPRVRMTIGSALAVCLLMLTRGVSLCAGARRPYTRKTPGRSGRAPIGPNHRFRQSSLDPCAGGQAMSATATRDAEFVESDQAVTLKVGPGGLDRYLQLVGDKAGPRIKYRQGSLTLVSPSRPHERDGDAIDQVIQAIGEELDIDFYALASTLYRHDPKQVGIELDKSYMIARAEDDRPRLDPDNQPIPDLVVEVVASHAPNHSLRICQALGVPEVWTYRVFKHALEFLVLGADGQYAAAERSRAFPFLAPADVFPWILQDPAHPEPGNHRRRRLRAWVREVLAPRRAAEAPRIGD